MRKRILFVFFVVCFNGCTETPKTEAKIETPAKTVAKTKTPLSSEDKSRKKLEAEFVGAYPTDDPKATKTVTFELTAKPTKVQLFEGQVIDVWAYNAQVPGPVLRVRLGDEVKVKFKNELPQPTTIHWHGVRVPNAMDGVPGVTQDPIPPGSTFEYKFVPKDAGTFWFHPHVRGAEQVERGLYGVLIVDDAESKYVHDEVWVLDDWKLGKDGQIDPRFVTRSELAHDGRWGNRITVNGDAASELSVPAGARLRLRIINTSNGRVYKPDFGELDAKVIAVDGLYTSRPLSPVGFELAPGNRLDLEITIPADASERRYVVTDRFTRRAIPLATIRVSKSKVVTPKFASPSNDHIPQWDLANEMPVDFTYRLNARRGGERGIEWTINGEAWNGQQATAMEGGRWTKLRFQNDSGRIHPMHIHGQFFKVIARGGVPVDEPYFRDTVLVHGRETIDIGMVPTDWGHWMMHCHILEHAEAGMMTTIDVK